MPHYHYKGRDNQSNVVSGELDGANEMAVAEQLMRRGITPTALTEQNAKASAALNWSLAFSKRVTLEELVMFTRQMYALTKAGIPILRAIHGLEEHARSDRFRQALATLKDDLGNGKPISVSMQAFPDVFSSLFVAIIHVGENTGKLEEAFLQLTRYFELEMETRKRIKTALRYPSFVLMALVVAMVVLNIFVIPTFATMFARFGAELPWATKVLLATSHFFVSYWVALLVGAGLTILAVRYWLKTAAGLLFWHRNQLRLPIVGSILQRALMARFCRSFAMMLRSGVPINHALSMVSEAVDNVHIGQHVREMRAGVERGESLLRIATNSHLFTGLVIQMIAVGEETGLVDQMIQEAAEYYEREVDYDLKTLTAKIEPILIVIVAVMVLILALGIFTPMWDMMRVFKGQS
jgi:MSHA biogenesis protein MshG